MHDPTRSPTDPDPDALDPFRAPPQPQDVDAAPRPQDLSMHTEWSMVRVQPKRWWRR